MNPLAGRRLETYPEIEGPIPLACQWVSRAAGVR